LKRAVFLDRDGTMIEEVSYLRRLEDIALFPWTADAIRALDRAGLAVVVTTNQSGVARGFLTEALLGDIHRAIAHKLDAARAPVRAYYYCPHHPDGQVPAFTKVCDCRKPASGMVMRAARELGLDPASSFVVGDSWLDVGLARSCGAQAILVRTGNGAQAEAAPIPNLTADVIVDNLAAAASWILQSLKSEV